MARYCCNTVLTAQSKSQLAIRYAHEVYSATPRPFVFWVHASTRTRFAQAYKDIADRLELAGRDDPNADILMLVCRWLSDASHGRQWMMVVDNVDDVETFFPSPEQAQEGPSNKPLKSLAEYLPQSFNGSMLITSRSNDAAAKLAGGYNKIKEIAPMDKSQGLQLFRNKLHVPAEQESAALDLLQALDYMPLAISQAAAYINRGAFMTIAVYLSEFRASDKNRESLLNRDAVDLRRDTSASNSVVTAWQMSFERIRQERSSAADLLSLMSFFNPQGIPEWILRNAAEIGLLGDALLGDATEIDTALNEDLNILKSYSLVKITANEKMCEMHALVQFCTRVWLSSFSKAERWKGIFIELMAQEFPHGEYENWAKCQQLLPHTEALYDAEPSSDESSQAWVEVLENVAHYMWKKGSSYKTAHKLAINALRVQERVLGPDALPTLYTAEILGVVLGDLGNYEEAETLHRRILKGREKELGEQHLDTLGSMNNLALVLNNQGKHEEAETLHRRALQWREKELGEQHLNTQNSLNNLALVLRNQGKYEEAETLHRRALQRREKELGEQHPDTLQSMNNLALVLRNQGKYEEAETLHRRALQRQEKELGEQHPDTLQSMNNLAVVLRSQDKYKEAETLYRRALQGKEEKLGLSHPVTLDTVYNLALLLHEIKRYDKAEELYQRAYDGRMQKLGPQHPDTVKCGKWFLKLQEEVEQAELAQREKSAPIDIEPNGNTAHREHVSSRLSRRKKRRLRERYA
jgi:tetratricopeptide (TPR) repeat protein